ncbi:MAG: DinB family protein [Gemmatimonadales bacterium]
MPSQHPDVEEVPTEAMMDVMKAELLRRFAREHETTMRVVGALPESECGFRPHERSSSALELLATLAREQAGMAAVLDGTWTMPPSFPAQPETWASALAMLDAGATRVLAALTRTSASRLAESVPFFTGPGAVGLVPIHELLWFWLLDTVHHRGQLSVYVRMVGGRVPAIYGPSADEPWS